MRSGRVHSQPGNRTLSGARAAKQDEFYTQLDDIALEVKHYRSQFEGKVVLCNCDDPYESKFFEFFALNFNALKLKRLITTSYADSPIVGSQSRLENFEGLRAHNDREPYFTSITEVRDIDGSGAINKADIERLLEVNKCASNLLDQGGDFRSPECIALLQEADIVVTNPPFSLFREYIAQLMEFEKQFLIIGNTNAITYKEVFPLIRQNRLWLGCTNFNVGMFFEVPDDWERFHRINPITGKKLARVSTACWYTNLHNRKREEYIPLHRSITTTRYPVYANYDAIEVAKVADIPVDYDGEMGVPVTFLSKYNPEQFEIVGSSMMLARPMSDVAPKGTFTQGGPSFYTPNGDGTYRRLYFRIVIKHRRG